VKNKLSLLTITKNAGETFEKTLDSVGDLADQIVVIDDYSSDNTVEIACNSSADVYFNHEPDLGKQKQYGLEKTTGDWVLLLDADEQLSSGLKKEIATLLKSQSDYDGYVIPYQNHFLGKPLHYGGENYKMLRLFRRNAGIIAEALVHEHVSIRTGKIGELKHKINHYSYRSLWQMFTKFSHYAYREALQKAGRNEHSSLKKLTMYPAHMFYARFIKDKGYKDGLYRIPLDLGFAYMEFLTYVLLLFVKKKSAKHFLTYT
jgi:glycosyltransferase involved in cell wall biosynthesis